MKREQQQAMIGLKNGNIVIATPQKDHYTSADGQRIEYPEVAWYSTDMDKLEVRR